MALLRIMKLSVDLERLSHIGTNGTSRKQKNWPSQSYVCQMLKLKTKFQGVSVIYVPQV